MKHFFISLSLLHRRLTTSSKSNRPESKSLHIRDLATVEEDAISNPLYSSLSLSGVNYTVKSKMRDAFRILVAFFSSLDQLIDTVSKRQRNPKINDDDDKYSVSLVAN